MRFCCTNTRKHTKKTYIYIYIYIYMCVCVCFLAPPTSESLWVCEIAMRDFAAQALFILPSSRVQTVSWSLWISEVAVDQFAA